MLDATGFKRKTYADLLAEMEGKARELFGANVNTSAFTPLGILLRIFAWALSFTWQDSEDVYNSGYKNTAAGNNLDRLAPYVGITRISERAATGTLSITGTPNYTVPEGFQGATSTDYLFQTLEPVQLAADGTGSVPIVAVIPGRSGNVAANTITVIVNPDANVTSITNPQPTAGGREKETDIEMKDRWDLSVAGGGASTPDSIRAALLDNDRTPGVRAAVVIENTTMAVDAGGRPPKSFEAYVLGGSPAEIAQTILDMKAAGIESHGSQTVTVNDLSGNPHTIKYSNAVEVQIHVRATINTNVIYPPDGDQQIVSAIVRYIGGEDSDGQLYVGLNMGEDVIQFQANKAVGNVPGLDDALVEFSLDGAAWSPANVQLAAQQVAQTTNTIISVVHAP